MGGIQSLGKNMNALVNVVVVVVIGLVFLSKMQGVSGLGTTANTGITTALGFIDDIFDWGSLIVLVLAIAYVRKVANSATG